MPEDSQVTEKEIELFEGNVKLRLNLVKKKISEYFEDVEEALRRGKPPPPPQDSKD